MYDLVAIERNAAVIALDDEELKLFYLFQSREAAAARLAFTASLDRDPVIESAGFEDMISILKTTERTLHDLNADSASASTFRPLVCLERSYPT